MMGFLHIGQNVMVNDRRIIGIFDLDITSQSAQTRRFLDQAEKDSVVLPEGRRNHDKRGRSGAAVRCIRRQLRHHPL